MALWVWERRSQGTRLDKPTALETNRSKAALSGRRRENRYETHFRKGKSFLRDRNKRDRNVRQRIAGKQRTERNMDLRRTGKRTS